MHQRCCPSIEVEMYMYSMDPPSCMIYNNPVVTSRPVVLGSSIGIPFLIIRNIYPISSPTILSSSTLQPAGKHHQTRS